MTQKIKNIRRVLHDYLDDPVYYSKLMCIALPQFKQAIYTVKRGRLPKGKKTIKEILLAHRMITGDARDDTTLWFALLDESPNHTSTQ